ncbi:hypothetical protein M9H77_15396 [Catharanthus roseus]|uniref:Uncharacterized protein n=1 Tax=Catharanthus roseus TaxID=4058 RepID=A0ACC0B0U6_CATRO|nr:hypothetical protein M9H77_15396 [Catharanthus roseus]
MMNHNDIQKIRFGIGVIGDVTSFFLFFSPFFTFRRIWKNKSVEEFHPYPYLAAVLNCAFWVLYGLPMVSLNNPLVIVINSIGLALELGYLYIFFKFADKKQKFIVAGILMGEAVFIAGMATITMEVFHTISKRTNFVGAVCVFFGIILYGSPLSVMVKVFKTKSVEFLPFWVCFAGFSNGIVWSIYAVLGKLDPYILTGNGIGAILGFIQLILFACYRKTTPVHGQKPDKKSEVQLQNV